MSKKNVLNTHIRARLPELHRALIDIVGEMNRPERDGEMLAAAGLSLERALFPLLVLVERLGPIGIVELAGRVGRDYTTVSRQVGRLEELGLVSRRSGSADRRVREAAITARGKAATDAGGRRARAHGAGAVRRLGSRRFRRPHPAARDARRRAAQQVGRCGRRISCPCLTVPRQSKENRCRERAPYRKWHVVSAVPFQKSYFTLFCDIYTEYKPLRSNGSD